MAVVLEQNNSTKAWLPGKNPPKSRGAWASPFFFFFFCWAVGFWGRGEGNKAEERIAGC